MYKPDCCSVNEPWRTADNARHPIYAKGLCKALKCGKKKRGGTNIVQSFCGRANLRIVTIRTLQARNQQDLLGFGPDYPAGDDREGQDEDYHPVDMEVER